MRGDFYMDTQIWKPFFSEFKEKTAQFYNGTISQGDYKSCSGLYGSYAQRGGEANMLRLRMTAGRVTKEKMNFAAGAVKNWKEPAACLRKRIQQNHDVILPLYDIYFHCNRKLLSR